MSRKKLYVIPISSFSLSLSSSLPLSLGPSLKLLLILDMAFCHRNLHKLGHGRTFGATKGASIVNLNRPKLDPMSYSTTSNKESWICLGLMSKGSICAKESWICLAMMSKGSICSKESWIMPRNARRKP